MDELDWKLKAIAARARGDREAERMALDRLALMERGAVVELAEEQCGGETIYSLPENCLGTVVTTIHGNKLRRFEDGWSPLKGAHWDRWTVYTDAELAANFTLIK